MAKKRAAVAKKPAPPKKPATKTRTTAASKPTAKPRKKAAKKKAGRAATPPPPKLDARIERVRELLERAVPDPQCELQFETPWQLLIATILSAQSTDRTVNDVTPELFRRWPTPADLAAAEQEDVEQVVHRTGFFRNKAKAIRTVSRQLVEQHGSEVPRELDAALDLHGVARKTANLVLGTAYGIPTGIIVDTHARRVSQRLGLTRNEDPVKIEADLCTLFPREDWVDTGHRLVLHGRYTCTARAPRCEGCDLEPVCPARETFR